MNWTIVPYNFLLTVVTEHLFTLLLKGGHGNFTLLKTKVYEIKTKYNAKR